MDASIRPYFCGELPCENKSCQVRANRGIASFATAFFLLRFTDTLPVAVCTSRRTLNCMHLAS